MSGYYVYSTLSNDQAYAGWAKPNENSLPVRTKTVLIKGGANVANKTLVTPKGVPNAISDEDLEFLKKNRHFVDHMKRGFIKIGKRGEADKVAKDMTAKDQSAPRTPDDFGDKAPTFGAIK